VKAIRREGRVIKLSFFILSVIFCWQLLAFTAVSCAETTIRILLLGEKFSKIPKNDEKVEKLGKGDAEVLLNGLKYSGNIEVWKGENGLYIVNEMPLEDYIKGVVAGEVGSSWDLEALKAQAVVARTYALYQKLNNGTQKIGYDLTSSVLDQVFKGGPVAVAIIKAVNETRGEIITYEGKPIAAFYHSTSCNMTEDPIEVFGKSYPYLKPVETHCELSPYYLWEKKIRLADIEQALNIKGIKDILIDSYTVSQRVRDLTIMTESGEKRVPAKDLRKSLGWDRLPSTEILKILVQGDSCIFEGQGYGHGVGMCQWTALEMAREGAGYREILSKFYPGTTIELYEDR